MRNRREISSFNLSFLDIMFCGFGAVVLLVLVINANTLSSRKQKHADKRAEVMRLELENSTGQENLAALRNSLQETDEEMAEARGRSREVLARIAKVSKELADLRNETLARKSHIHKLQTDLQTLDRENRRLGAEVQADLARGKKIRRFEGEGHRQYLTGLKLGGSRVLLLIDASASMLAETVVNVIRRRNMDAETRRNSRKWRQAVKTAEWLIANLPPGTNLLAYTFNTSPTSLSDKQEGKWIPATDRIGVGSMISGLREVVPGDGTSLENGLALAKTLVPRPDNILLITDGLPTQGRTKPSGNTVSGEKRLELFRRAVNILPAGVPVNTILFPMEGDPMAAALYWKLAVDTGGSFLTPARDWP